MEALTTWKTSPPLSSIILNLLVVGWGHAADCEPIEAASSMLLILLEIANVHVAIRIDFIAITVFLIVDELALIYFAVLVYGNAYDRVTEYLHHASFDLLFRQNKLCCHS